MVCCCCGCSYPVPGHYSLTLEVSRNRTTSAREIVCDSVNGTLSNCPAGYLDGQLYTERSLNEPCNTNNAVRPISCLSLLYVGTHRHRNVSSRAARARPTFESGKASKVILPSGSSRALFGHMLSLAALVLPTFHLLLNIESA